MKEINKKIKLLFITCIMIVLPAEISSRLFLGLGDPMLFESSPVYGYRPLPNQNIRRIGNRIFYNAQGLRSEPISTYPKPGTIRILCIGDSITFGGVQTDQAETYPYQLQTILNRQGNKFEVLNASAGGWAIENEEAYLRQEGIYQSSFVVLELGSHDLFQPKNPGELGTINYPTSKPILALQEGFFRYLLPKFPNLQSQEANLQNVFTEKALKRNLASFNRIANIVKANKAQLIVILVEQPDKLEPKNVLANYSKKAIALEAKKQNVPYKNLGEYFRLAGDEKLFRDVLHPNPAGNKVMAIATAELIQNTLKMDKK